MLLLAPHQEHFAHIDFGYVAGSRPWFDANLLPIPERFMRCCVAANRWGDFVNDVVFAFTILQQERVRLWAVAAAFAEPTTRCGFPAYIANCLSTNTAEDVLALVKAAPSDLARRFKNMHHKFAHGND